MDISNSNLPEEAKSALTAYIKCKTRDSVWDCILPPAAANEIKTGKSVLGEYSFGFLPASYDDIRVLECEAISREQAERLADFWAAGFSFQGIAAVFASEEGFTVVVSVICTVNDADEDEDDVEDSEHPRLRFTNRIMLLKIKDDRENRWVVIPSADMDAKKLNPSCKR